MSRPERVGGRSMAWRGTGQGREGVRMEGISVGKETEDQRELTGLARREDPWQGRAAGADR